MKRNVTLGWLSSLSNFWKSAPRYEKSQIHFKKKREAEKKNKFHPLIKTPLKENCGSKNSFFAYAKSERGRVLLRGKEKKEELKNNWRFFWNPLIHPLSSDFLYPFSRADGWTSSSTLNYSPAASTHFEHDISLLEDSDQILAVIAAAVLSYLIGELVGQLQEDDL